MMSNFFKMPREGAASNACGGWNGLSTSLIAVDRAGGRVLESRARKLVGSEPGRLTGFQRAIRLFFGLSALPGRPRKGMPEYEARNLHMLQHRLHLWNR